MNINRETIKANCHKTLNSIHPDHRDALTATTLAEVGRSTDLSWTEIEAVMKNVAIENEYRAVDADDLNIAELITMLEFFRVDGELCITEPTSREQFGIAAILDPEANASGSIWGVRVLEPGSYDVLAESTFETLIEARVFTAETLSPEWRMSNNQLVRR